MTEIEIEEWVSWWFCFLDLSDEYWEYCEAKAINDERLCKEIEEFTGTSLDELYKDWGVLWNITFRDINDPAWKSWFEPRRHLFLDAKITDAVTLLDKQDDYEPRSGHVLLDIPLSMHRNEIERQIRELLKPYSRAEYKPRLIPAKYKLYKRNVRGATLAQIRSAYEAWGNENGRTRLSKERFVAENGLGARTDVGTETKKLLLVNPSDIKDLHKRDLIRAQRRSFRNSYERYAAIGNEYLRGTLFGMFPCTNKQLEDELAKRM